MPGVKKLHQESESNNKAEYIFGHSCQAVAVLAQALSSVFALPLACRIHEGGRGEFASRNRSERHFSIVISTSDYANSDGAFPGASLSLGGEACYGPDSSESKSGPPGRCTGRAIMGPLWERTAGLGAILMREESAGPAGRRYRIELNCDGVPPSVESAAAIDIKEEFGHRPWHENVQRGWN